VNQDKETTVYLREVNIRVGLRETTTVEPSNEHFSSRVHKATGKLAFKVDGGLDREWKDDMVPLENHVHEILDYMEVAARDLEKSWAEN
jgi:vacuolar-type H+-ATPase catalytic subunit A/Vma1